MRANSGVRFAVSSAVKSEAISDAGAAGKSQTTAAGAGAKIWFCGAAGMVETGAGAGAADLAQHAFPQWQAGCALNATQAAGAGVKPNDVPASSRLQTMASVNFIGETLLPF